MFAPYRATPAPKANERPIHRRRLVPAALLIAAATTATLLGTAPSAGAATVPAHGRFSMAWQSTVTHQIHVHGAAVDPHRPKHSVKVGIFVDGKYRKKVVANRPTRPHQKGGLHGRHTFDTVVNWPRRARTVTLAVYENGHRRMTVTRHLMHRTPAGEKIVAVAKRYVGSQYVYGAAGPHAFDCSGYAMFVYKQAHVASLPHNSEAQRHARHMRPVSRAAARPGDLVFYMSGGSSYHVAIYAGHGMQYSATDPAQGVRHQPISSRSVVFGSDWH